MDILQMVQSILTYFCTAGFVAACRYAVVLSKRVTILEQQMEYLSYMNQVVFYKMFQ